MLCCAAACLPCLVCYMPLAHVLVFTAFSFVTRLALDLDRFNWSQQSPPDDCTALTSTTRVARSIFLFEPFDLQPRGHQRRACVGINSRIDQERHQKTTAPTRCTSGMGWFGGRSDSVETVEGAQEVVSRVSSDLAKKKDTVKSL